MTGPPNPNTGQGIQEDDPDDFCATVEKRCQFYFDLLDIFSDCASVTSGKFRSDKNK